MNKRQLKSLRALADTLSKEGRRFTSDALLELCNAVEFHQHLAYQYSLARDIALDIAMQKRIDIVRLKQELQAALMLAGANHTEDAERALAEFRAMQAGLRQVCAHDFSGQTDHPLIDKCVKCGEERA